ncbi:MULTISPECIES: hypothetical protein [Flammeovirga]|uniref:Lipoprotein n=1 Tax=Flammeovirga agarivorans TaxID=2726742 RepID=A0A7X8SGC2_9BACT|nr:MULTISPECIES: hypothetical protein [Flammeovirga]NLR89633.1 hypothetical protein [Flammeovirga agarivorans]
MRLRIFFLSVISAFMFTSCGDAVDEVTNSIADALLDFGDATAVVDGTEKDFSNYAGYRVTGNSTALYFADFDFQLTALDVKGTAILAFMHTDLFSTSEGIQINLTSAPGIATDPIKGLGGALYLSNVSAQDLYDLVVEYNDSQSFTNVIALAAQKDVTVQRATALDIVTNLDLAGNITFNFTKIENDKASGTFSFKAYGEDGNVEVTDGTFADTPLDVTNFD